MVRRIFGFIKKAIFKIFGKARWIILTGLLALVLLSVTLFLPGLAPDLYGVRNSSGALISHVDLETIDDFSINDRGRVVLCSEDTRQGLAAGLELDTGETVFANIYTLSVDLASDNRFAPSKVVITDDDSMYGVRIDLRDDVSTIYSRETIVRISADYKYIGEVFSIDHAESTRMRGSKLSDLHYYKGAVTFASLEEDGVLLYSIDTKTQLVTRSELYPTDPDGTFTTSVIPIDGSFLFLRSDGNVYDVRFNEPLGESIYRFELYPDGESDHPYFDKAVLVNGKLYVVDYYSRNDIWLLENGEITKAYAAGNEKERIVSIDSYHPEGSDKDILVVCLNDGIMTCAGDAPELKISEIDVHNTLLMHLDSLCEHILTFSLIALLINLIIRKKTLLYKQLILILPLFAILAVTIAVLMYFYFDDQVGTRSNNDLNIICELGRTEFDGYDFSGLMEVNDKTGAAYKDLASKFDRLSTYHYVNWSENYYFMVVYISEDDKMIYLSGDDNLYMPLRYRSKSKFADSADKFPDMYIDNRISSIFTDSERTSKISAYGKIADKDNCGRYYLVVTTDTGALFSQRLDIFGYVLGIGLLSIIALTVIIVIPFLNIMRVIKKATKTVKDISDGNLSSRINYRSKDELGQICSQVNLMGQSLEKLFAEKDETEQFYYKFVPEKFRELLGKDNFTDLSLGDAKSSELTVLFCDIRSFSINSEMMTAKENFAFVNVIYGKMGPIIRENNGFVDKYIGDAVMALFENADDAVKCGIELYKAIVLDPATAEELKVSDINIGIGVHSGMAMVGIVGENERLAGTVISDTVNLSSRLESLTKQYKTAMLVSKDTIDRLSDPESLDLRYLGIVQVAGVNEVKAVYEVLDCLPEDQKELRSSNNRELKEAIRLFSLGRRADAVSALQTLEDSGKGDYVTEMYLKYISEMSDDDKGNVFRFVRK